MLLWILAINIKVVRPSGGSQQVLETNPMNRQSLKKEVNIVSETIPLLDLNNGVDCGAHIKELK